MTFEEWWKKQKPRVNALFNEPGSYALVYALCLNAWLNSSTQVMENQIKELRQEKSA